MIGAASVRPVCSSRFHMWAERVRDLSLCGETRRVRCRKQSGPQFLQLLLRCRAETERTSRTGKRSDVKLQAGKAVQCPAPCFDLLATVLTNLVDECNPLQCHVKIGELDEISNAGSHGNLAALREGLDLAVVTEAEVPVGAERPGRQPRRSQRFVMRSSAAPPQSLSSAPVTSSGPRTLRHPSPSAVPPARGLRRRRRCPATSSLRARSSCSAGTTEAIGF